MFLEKSDRGGTVACRMFPKYAANCTTLYIENYRLSIIEKQNKMECEKYLYK